LAHPVQYSLNSKYRRKRRDAIVWLCRLFRFSTWLCDMNVRCRSWLVAPLSQPLSGPPSAYAGELSHLISSMLSWLLWLLGDDRIAVCNCATGRHKRRYMQLPNYGQNAVNICSCFFAIDWRQHEKQSCFDEKEKEVDRKVSNISWRWRTTCGKLLQADYINIINDNNTMRLLQK